MDVDTFTTTCTICSGVKVAYWNDNDETPNELLECPHCDMICRKRACSICRQGMKGLAEFE